MTHHTGNVSVSILQCRLDSLPMLGVYALCDEDLSAEVLLERKPKDLGLL
jgi:hypothetical protein